LDRVPALIEDPRPLRGAAGHLRAAAPTSPPSPLPGQPLAENLEHQPAGAAEQRIKRRTDMAGAFPNSAALLRLVVAVLVEAHDEWQVSERRHLSKGSMALLDAKTTNPKGGSQTSPLTRAW
jgi:Transposase, Mutator family